MPAKKSVIVIGAGIGGITTALFLAKQGYRVQVFEKNSTPGGRCGRIIREGHRFDLGATIFFLPSVYREIFESLGLNIDDCFEFKPLETIYKLYYDDGSILDFNSRSEVMKPQLEALEPGSHAKMIAYVTRGYTFLKIGLGKLLARNFYHPFQFITIHNLIQILKIKGLLRHSFYIRRFFKHPHLRMAFTFQNIYVGQSPYQASALFSMLPAAEITEGSLFPKGGMHRIVEKLIELAQSEGVDFHYNKPVKEIKIEGKKTTGVLFEDGLFQPSDLVVANADLPYVYKQLLPPSLTGWWVNRMQHTCSAIVFHWGLDKPFPELSHHNVFLSDQYKESLDTIFRKGSLSEKLCFYIHAPVGTDPDAAPLGQDTYSVVVPVPYHDPDKDQDWPMLRQIARSGVMNRLKEFGIPDIEEHIKFEICYMPATWESTVHVSRGATFGSLSHRIMQMGYFRPHNQHGKYRNLYFTGGSTHPGNGIPLVLMSAKLTSERILHDHPVSNSSL